MEVQTQAAEALGGPEENIDLAISPCEPHYELEIGAVFHCGPGVPQMHRLVSLTTQSCVEASLEYVLVNRATGFVDYYEQEDITRHQQTLNGISTLVLGESSNRSATGADVHDLLQSNPTGQLCFVSTTLEDGLGLVICDKRPVQCSKDSAKQALVVPTSPMSLDDYLKRFVGKGNNWRPCTFTAGCSDVGDTMEDRLAPARSEMIRRSGADSSICKLIKLTNTFHDRLTGGHRRCAEAIRAAILSTEVLSWRAFIYDEALAKAIYIFLYHLNKTVEVKFVSVGILMESLLDRLIEDLDWEEQWECVDVTQRVNCAIASAAYSAVLQAAPSVNASNAV